MKKDLRMYILVNKDIKINKGKLAGQVGHAVASYMFHHMETNTLEITSYMNNYQKKIILYASQELLEQLESEHVSIRDKGWTDLEPNTLTCVNLGIIDFNDFPSELEYVKELKLCR